MATTAGQQDGGAPGTDMTGICFRDQLWLNTYPLDRNLVFDYFALSPFYDFTCNNEILRMQATHPLDFSHLSKMTGIEFMLTHVMEPHLFVFHKQKRESPEKVTPMLAYYVLDGSVYQAPQLCNVFASRVTKDPKQLVRKYCIGFIPEVVGPNHCSVGMSCLKIFGRALYHISKAFTAAASKLEKIGYVDTDDENAALDPKAGKEVIDMKEVMRVDVILSSLQRKLPPAPPPPPFPEGYAPPSNTEAENNNTEAQQTADAQIPSMDPIIDQGPAKRIKI